MADESRRGEDIAGQVDHAGIRTAAEEEARLTELAGNKEVDADVPETSEDERSHSDGPMPIKERTFASRQERNEYEKSEARIAELSEMNGLSYEVNDFLERILSGYTIKNDFLETIKKPNFEALVRQVLSQGETKMPLNEQLCYQCAGVISIIRHIERLDGFRKDVLGRRFAPARGESDFEGYQEAKERLARYPEPSLKAAVEDGEKDAKRWEDDIRRKQEQLFALLGAMEAGIRAIKNGEQIGTITVTREDDFKTEDTIGLYSLKEGMGLFASKADHEKIQALVYPPEKS